MLKKVFCTVLIFLCGCICSAEEITLRLGSDYVMKTKKMIDTITVDDLEILKLERYYALFNEKNIVFLKPEKIGKTRMFLFLYGKYLEVDVNIVSENDEFKQINTKYFDVSVLDEPPFLQDYELDSPPKIKEEIRE